jgi:mannose-6-phosphate isomerase-like protein (cupin superfamily)
MSTDAVTRKRGIVLLPGEGRKVSLANSAEVIFKVGDAESDGGRYSVMVGEIVANNPGPATQIHYERDDLNFVTKGTLVFEIDGETFEAPAGAFVLIPRGVPHRWANRSSEPVTLLNIHIPGNGFEEFLGELAALFSDGHKASPAQMAEIGKRHDTHFDEAELQAFYGD